jgi:hypothetical protein
MERSGFGMPGVSRRYAVRLCPAGKRAVYWRCLKTPTGVSMHHLAYQSHMGVIRSY